MAVYKKEFRSLGGYLTDGPQPNLSRVERFIQSVGSYEDKIFQKRAHMHRRQSDRIKRDKAQAKRREDTGPGVVPDSLVPVGRFSGSRLRLASGPSPSPFQQSGGSGTNMNNLGRATSDKHEKYNVRGTSHHIKVARLSSGASVGTAIVEAENDIELDEDDNKEELKIKLKGLLREKNDVFNTDNPEEDKIKLGEPGRKERYYEEKFSARTPEEIEAVRKDVVLKYTEGLCWVMHYFYEGVCSWQWFYPYHYAVFASDLKDLGELDIKFELGSPFKPFNQLLGVFPAASSHALPEQYRRLMTDSSSPIIDFYPTNFEVDMNGKRFSWQGIAKLPFIDEARLPADVEKIEHTLTGEEVRRNSTMCNMLFVVSSHPISPYVFSLDARCKHLSDLEQSKVREQIDPLASDGMNGYISLCNGDPRPDTFRPPAGVVFPKKLVTIADVKAPPALWHEDFGRRPWENGRRVADAAHRLVVSSLSHRQDHRDSLNPKLVEPPYYPAYPNARHQGHVGAVSRGYYNRSHPQYDRDYQHHDMVVSNQKFRKLTIASSAADDNPGFISIDCGATEEYTDGVSGLFYHTDDGFIDTGTNHQIPSSVATAREQLRTLRSFPEGTKNCYTLKSKQGNDNVYMIRPTFVYGNYDGKNQDPSFDLYVGVSKWITITVSGSTESWCEITYVPSTNYISFCLVNINQVDAIMEIKMAYRVTKNWQGDPCDSTSWSGLNCSGSNYPRIVSLNLSSSGLSGMIAPSVSRLTFLQFLDLSNNNLTGPLPKFIGEFPLLKVLDLSGNDFIGLIPEALMGKSINGTLSLRLDRNPNLCLSVHCKRKEKSFPLIPVIAAVSVLMLAVLVLAAFAIWWKCKRSGMNKDTFKSKKQEFTFNEIIAMTDNLSTVIGVGGSGTVYLGTLKSSLKVAVKLLSPESDQGPKEFLQENSSVSFSRLFETGYIVFLNLRSVELLMRVHHSNVVSLIGYCKHPKHMALIYEYMPNGNVRQQLYGISHY
ncbi:hypothetical protein QQ045_016577 [Rhodiola kirilowii]